MSPYDARANHVVTAVIVAHDGASWLPEVVAALRAQTRPVQRVVAVDTGSRDRSGAVLAELLGTEAVFGLDRATGFGAAVTQALRHRAASAPLNRPAGSAPRQDAVEWLWLLHDDCAPDRDALEQLMLVAGLGRTAVVGPKVRRWDDPRILAEAGLRIDRAGRRVTGLDPDEYDQGQHDGERDVLAVGSAGMLVRRDVWDSLGGFDPALPLVYDDIDFCWRVNAAGYRVRLFTGAAIRHAEAAANGHRVVSALAPPTDGFTGQSEPAPRLRRAVRRSALYVLLANLPLVPMLMSLLGSTAGSLLRALVALLVLKRPAAAWDEVAALGEVVGNPVRLLLARRGRPSGRRRAYRIFRSSLPRAGALALFTDITALAGQPDGTGRLPRSGARSGLAGVGALNAAAGQARDGDARHRAARGGDVPGGAAERGRQPDDELPIAVRLAHRIIRRPGLLLAASLALLTLIAGRSLLVGGPLGGGAMVPAWGGASGLWREYLSGFHDFGVGSASAAPPYVAVLAAVATILGGKPWLAVELLLLGSVPLAGVTAYLGARRITSWMPARIWAAATYALLPAATGAIAAGRIGTSVTIALLPLAGILAGRILTSRGRPARRAAWAAGLTVAVAAAFVPLAWALAVILAILAVPLVWVFGRNRRATLINLAIAAIVPAALLFPWTLELFAHPSLFLVEAGIPRPGLSDPALPASSLLLFSPGGPGAPAVWVTTGIAVAGLAALLRRSGRFPVAGGWLVALVGLLAGIVVSRLSEVAPGAGQAVNGWPGVPLTLAAAGVLFAAVAASDTIPALLRHRAGGDGARDLPGDGARDLPGNAARDLPGDGARDVASGGVRGRFAARGKPAGWFAAFPSADAFPGLRGIQAGRVPWRRISAALVIVFACSAPLLAAGAWISRDAAGPLGRAPSTLLPALASASPGSGTPPGTLVLRPGKGNLTYTVLRGSPPLPGDSQLSEPSAAQHRLDGIVVGLASGSGGDVGADGNALASFGIGYVMLPGPAAPGLSRLLDGTPGLRQLSMSSAFGLWRVDGVTARVRVTQPGGTVVPVPSGAVDVQGAKAPRSGGTLVLAEPADAGWRATLNGRPLAALPAADGWAQAFRLPPGGGRLDVTRDMTGHSLSVLAEGLLLLVVAGLALPGLQAAGVGEGAHAPGAGAQRRSAAHARHRRRARPAREHHVPEPDTQAPSVPAAGAHSRGAQIRDAPVPAADARVAYEPGIPEPIGHEPVGREPVGREPVGREPVGREHGAHGRPAHELVGLEDGADGRHAPGGPAVSAGGAHEPGAEWHHAEERIAEALYAERRLVEESSAEALGAHEHDAAELGADGHGADELDAEGRAAERDAAEQVAAEQVAAERRGPDEHGPEEDGEAEYGFEAPGAGAFGAAAFGAERHEPEEYGVEERDVERYGVEERGVEEYGAEGHGAEEHKAEQHQAVEHQAEEHEEHGVGGAEEQGNEEQRAEEQGTEEQGTEEQGAEEHWAEEHEEHGVEGAEEHGTEPQAAEEQAAEEQAAEEQAAEEHGAEEHGAEGAEEQGTEEYRAEEHEAETVGADENGVEGAPEHGAEEHDAEQDGAEQHDAEQDGAEERGGDEDRAEGDSAGAQSAEEYHPEGNGAAGHERNGDGDRADKDAATDNRVGRHGEPGR